MARLAAATATATATATIVSHEVVLFEWLGGCTHPRFREVLAIVKAAG